LKIGNRKLKIENMGSVPNQKFNEEEFLLDSSLDVGYIVSIRQSIGIRFNPVTLEKCTVFNVKRGRLLDIQMPAISVSGIPIPLPFLSREDSMLAETSDAFKSKGRITN
jgi:hypothetical protein